MHRDATHFAADVLALVLALALAVRFAVAPSWPTAAALALAVGLVLGLRYLSLRVESRELADVREQVDRACKDASEAHRAMAAMLERSKGGKTY